jgi:hypothetical protein
VDNADGMPISSLDVTLLVGIGWPATSWPTGIQRSRHADWRIGFRPLQPGVGRQTVPNKRMHTLQNPQPLNDFTEAEIRY